MNKQIKLNDPADYDVYFTSDWHLNHDPKAWNQPLWMMRGYNSVDEHNQDIINKVNARVREKDYLINCGDIALHTKPEDLEAFLGQIVCKNIYLIFGNHCGPDFQIFKRECAKLGFGDHIEVYPMKFKNVTFLGNYQEFSIRKKRVIVSHFPFEVFNKSHHGAWHISGHSHYSNPKTRAGYRQGLRLDVSWEGKNDIYSFAEIEDIMNYKRIQQLDHHDENTN